LGARYINYKLSRSSNKTLNYQRAPLIITIGLVAIVMLAGLAYAFSPSQATEQQARSDFAAAFKLLHSANVAGATNPELSNLTQQLNAALKMIDDSEVLDKQGKAADANALRSQAISLLNTVPKEAADLRASAEQRTSQERILTYLLAPIMAGLVVLAYHYGGKAYRRYRIARTMGMKVKVKPNAKNK
jgi:hypothetical protein